MDQELRDKNGKLIGRIRSTAVGRQEIRDHTGKLRGSYDERSNETRDDTGRLVGKGNQLSSLLR